MPAGVYIHIPFCKSRCSYCDFATDIYRDPLSVDRYVKALINELVRFEGQIPEIDTIYLGGGTPSLLTARQLDKILAAIFKRFAIQKKAEITLEMNPATVSIDKLNDFRKMGVNRASFGIQTFDDRSLRLLSRGHDANDARQTYKLLRRAGFENISFDLIAGLPHQTLSGWDNNLNEAIGMDPEHISLYLLEIHEGTPLAEQIGSQRQPLPDEDLAAEMYELMVEKLTRAGFSHYEISNFARPGKESKHNRKYWLCEPVYGFGVSAHSFDGKSSRWANVRDTNRYVELLEESKSPVVESVRLTPKELSGEFAFLRLRLKEGLKFKDFYERFDYDLETLFKQDFENFKDLGLIELDSDGLRLTAKGFLHSNEIFSIFV